MITVDEALDRIFELMGPLGAECVPLTRAAGRVAAEPIIAKRDQPPVSTSAMDGYAIAERQVTVGARFAVVGESAAGHGFDGAVGAGEAVRIFTGAPLPQGARRVVIQEDVIRDGDTIVVRESPDDSPYIRRAGLDFARGDQVAPARPLRPADIALIAAMGHDQVLVHRRPEVAVIATGDELVAPGEVPRPDQVFASNNFGLAALVEEAGGIARLLPVARDTEDAVAAAFDLARGADLIVTIGGASVGDHDLVARAAEAQGLKRAFHTVAMRPGKPLMAGRIFGTPMLGLPGNPVSAMVCGTVFVIPALRAMLGLGRGRAPRHAAPLAEPLAPNGPREHYMRAVMTPDGLRAFASQDSSRLRVLAEADALIVRPSGDGAHTAGDVVEYLPI